MWRAGAPYWWHGKAAARCPSVCGPAWKLAACGSMPACSPRMAVNRSARAAPVPRRMVQNWGGRWPRRCWTAARIVCFGSRGAELNTVRSRTLEGRRIVVTRAPEQSKELRERLEESGAEVMVLPLIRFLEPEETVDLDRAIRSLEEFDWLSFTSANAVAFFQRRCRALGMGPSGKAPKIAAVGSATRLALQKEGLQASLVPAEFSGAGLAAGLAGAIAAEKVLPPPSH